MKRYYILHVDDMSIKRRLEIKLKMEGMDITLLQKYNYILTEFCHLSPLFYGNEILINSAVIHKIINALEEFMKTGKPSTEKIYYKNLQRVDISLFERIINQKIEDEYDSLESPTREYLEEDYEAVEYCIEWLKIGLDYSANLYVSNYS